MRKAAKLLGICGLLLMPAILIAGGKYDGNWKTTLTCPAKGNTEGYTWEFVSVVRDNNFHGERGTAGEPGYLLIEGKIADDGNAKLNATGIVVSKTYARGVFTHTGADYSYGIKAQFKETEGSGMRNEGLGVVGRPCTFEFVKLPAATQDSGR